MLRNINTVRNGLGVMYRPQCGVLGSAIPGTGVDGPSIMYPQLQLPTDATVEWSYWVESNSCPTGFWPLSDEGTGARGPYSNGNYAASVALYRFDVRQFVFPFTLQVGTIALPVVTGQPAPASVVVGLAAAFAFSFSGAASVQAQRRANVSSAWVNVPGATLTAYVTALTTLADGGAQFRFGATGLGGGPVWTNIVSMNVTGVRPQLVDPVSFIDMLDRVLPYATTCPAQTAEFHLREVAADFFQRTLAWRDDIGPDATVSGQGSYTLLPPESTNVAKFIACAVDGQEIESRDGEDGQAIARHTSRADAAWTLDRAVVHFSPVPPESGKTLSFRVALKPSRTASGLPNDLFQHYVHHIVDGALARILSLPKQSFTDLVLASSFKASYELAVARVALAKAKGFGKRRSTSAARSRFL